MFIAHLNKYTAQLISLDNINIIIDLLRLFSSFALLLWCLEFTVKKK